MLDKIDDGLIEFERIKAKTAGKRESPV